MRTTPSRRVEALWSAILVMGVLGTFSPVVLGQRTLLYRDVARLYAPVRHLVVEALRHSRLPLWNPYVAAGKALFAEGVHGVLHPVSLLGALVAPGSLDFMLLAYVVCAALGAAALARTIGCGASASAAAGFAFGLAGYTVSMTANMVFLAGAASLPWIAAALRASAEGRPFGVPLGAAAVAAGLFSGDVQVASIGVALGLALAADAGGWRGLRRAATGIAIGGLLASVHLAASWHELGVTYRGVGLTDADSRTWALSPWRLIELVAPGFFRGDVTVDSAPVFVALDPESARLDHPVPFADSIFVGASVLALALLAPRRRLERLLAAGAAVFLWLALGHHGGARQALAWVPLWSSFRYAEKLVGPLTLCLALLAAMGVDRAAREGLSKRARWWLFGAIGAAAGGALLCLFAPGLAAVPFQLAEATETAARDAVAHLGIGMVHAATALAFVAVAMSPRAARARGPLLVVAVAVPAIVATPFARYFADPALARIAPPVLVADPPGSRVVRVGEAYSVGGSAAARTDLVGVATIAARRSALPATNVAARVDTIEDYSGFHSRRHINLVHSFGDGFPVAARRYGTTHVAVIGRTVTPEIARASAAAIAGGRQVVHERDLELEFWEVPHRPWAFFARSAIAVDHPAKGRDLLLDLPPAGEDGTVVIEAPAAPPCAPGRVLAIEREAERVRIEAEADGEALLVVNDAFWPGWEATVDGREVPLFPADVLVRAVRWPPGRHVLEMRYDPPEVRFGWRLSALGGALLAMAVAHPLRGRRPKPPPSTS